VVRDGIAEATSDYWRGRIWGPRNFLVSEGLRRYGFDDEVHSFAKKSLRLFLQEWQDENHVHENYNDLTGEGDDVLRQMRFIIGGRCWRYWYSGIG
jgi:hypothetical protein